MKNPIIKILILIISMYTLLLELYNYDIVYLIELGGIYLSDFHLKSIIVSSLLHSSFKNFSVNIIILAIEGCILENVLGSKKFLTLILVSMLASTNMIILFDQGVNHVIIGSSDIIYGFLAVLFLISIIERNSFNLLTKMIIWSYLIYVIIGNIFYNEGVSVLGHVGGFIGGMVLFMVWFIKYSKTNDKRCCNGFN